MKKEISYTTRSFYVPMEKMHIIETFQQKCKADNRKSYSEVILELMSSYNRL